MDHSFSLHFLQKREHDEAVVLCFFFWGSTKTQKAFILIHSYFKIIARALLPVCIYLALKTTHHSDRPTREEELSCHRQNHFYPRERTNAFGALVFLFLSRSVDNTHRYKKRRPRAFPSNKKSPPPQNDTLFSSLLKERGRIIENK